jgi:pyruvate dehydrogenase E1 component alpha subunit/2-oxoisovalerate dehydrogenase E1 component alpha subunit
VAQTKKKSSKTGRGSRKAAAGRGPAFAYFDGDAEAKARGLFQLVAEDGSFDEADVAGIDKEQALALFRGMLSIRVIDARMIALQRQGRIGFYGEALGQEASVVGAAAALSPRDWLVPALREAGAGLYRGMSLGSYLAQILGNSNDVCKGRQMPCHPCDRDTNYVVMSSVVSTQIPHAVGIAMAMKLKETDEVCMGFMGDGGTSEGDFHTALTFAGVFAVPAVLVCQNNQWAISTPGKDQCAADTIALKGLGYGIESLRADGNDVFAVYELVKHAVQKARRGDGPTFIELLTYRVSAHSTSDDPSRYRDESVTEVWKQTRDPLRRQRAFLAARGWLSDDEAEAMSAEIEEHVREVIAEQELAGPPELDTLIEDVFAEPTWLLREQLAQFKGD